MAVRAKRFEYAVSVDASGATTEDGTSLAVPEAWSADHLLLAARVRCSLTSLGYHARRVAADARGSGRPSGVVTKRNADGRYAFVEVRCELEDELEPPPDEDALRELVAKAERDCFVGASLAVPPTYAWRVNGADVAPDP